METLCKIRDLYRAIAEFETRFEKAHHLCLNEGMLLCCLSRKKRLSSGEIAEQLGLSNSNTSKVIRSVEDKGYIERNLGDCDKRQMYFSLTAEGKKILKEMPFAPITGSPELSTTVPCTAIRCADSDHDRQHNPNSNPDRIFMCSFSQTFLISDTFDG